MSGMQGAGPTDTNIPQGQGTTAQDGPAPAQPAPAPAPVPLSPEVARSRLGGLWAALISGTVVLILLLVFILINGQHVQINFYGAHWNLPLGVALLMAAAIGILLVVVPGVGRMLQLKAAARRERRRAARQAADAGRAGAV